MISPRLLVTLCTFNERENVERLVPEIHQQLPQADVLVIDDNSPDGTGQLADRLAGADSRVYVLHRPGKLGLGTAILAGFRYAIEHGYSHVINMDADFSHPPRFLPAVYEASNRVDVAIGSRYVDGGGVEWQGKPVWIVRRTPEMMELLAKHDAELTDAACAIPQQPDYCNNPNRSIKPEIFVVVGICTHLGCSPSYRPEKAPADLGANWGGGWFCPCHGSRFDMSARVYQGSPAPTNMIVPPHQYLSDTLLLIGDDKKKGVA